MPNQIDIAAQIDTLIKLQEIDAQIYRLRDEKQRKPQELARLDAEFKEKSAALKAAEARSTALQLKKKEKEGALSVKEEQIKKLQAQLYQIKTNKEYSAMQHEIDGQKADMSLIEDEILILMDEMDRARQGVAKEKEALAQEEAHLKEKQEEVATQLNEIEKELEKLAVDRQAVVPLADSNILRKYEKILTGKGGLAIVPVNGDSCQGCNMHMPPQVLHQIRMKQEFIICENCTRFLYINDSI